MATLFWLCLFARMHSDQWQSYFLCRGQGPVYFWQNETEGGIKKARLTEHSRPQKAAAPPPSPPRLVSYSQSVDSEFILRDLTHSVSHTLPAGTITSLSDYNGPPAVLPVYKNTPRKPS